MSLARFQCSMERCAICVTRHLQMSPTLPGSFISHRCRSFNTRCHLCHPTPSNVRFYQNVRCPVLPEFLKEPKLPYGRLCFPSKWFYHSLSLSVGYFENGKQRHGSLSFWDSRDPMCYKDDKSESRSFLFAIYKQIHSRHFSFWI